ncbi:hypothetical protein FNH05_03505 [Amycolatopsis rhizosphaerae]|uniref:Uncharacterized protein n=1 Tax=Amycolatopsis rhizosphaerae TaxID=2053003 RepID=A0A558DJG4_9PSEU|nr:hypothetical protein [Amycolatopsis rhizosphaerae]TVT61152.1 hypothetical protein FNH05_03505 [Amycolatopsis rhizosphaerae]
MKYCKAYRLDDLRRFPGWDDGADRAERELDGEQIAYVCDDFTVVTDPIKGEGLLFGAVTPEWREFCAGELEFAIPADPVGASAEPGDS